MTIGAGSGAGAGGARPLGSGGAGGNTGTAMGGGPGRDADTAKDVASSPDGASDTVKPKNPYLPECFRDPYGKYVANPRNGVNACIIPDSLTFCSEAPVYGGSVPIWTCGTHTCPTDSSGGFPGADKMICQLGVRYKCLYPDGTLCRCEDIGRSPKCESIEGWFGQLDAGARDTAPIDVGRKVSEKVVVCSEEPTFGACVDSTYLGVETKDCGACATPPNAFYYSCILPDSRTMCGCESRRWVCPKVACPENAQDRDLCEPYTECMNNSSGKRCYCTRYLGDDAGVHRFTCKLNLQ